MDKLRKYLYILIILIPTFFILFFSNKLSNKSYFGTIITIYVVFILFISYLYFEKSKKGVHEIAIIATISSFAAISRVPFASIPNVQPVTFIVSLAGLVFGVYDGFLIGATTAFISNIFLGQGPWTPWQMLSWGIVGAISGLIGKSHKQVNTKIFAFINFLFGFLFGAIMNLWHLMGYVKVISIESILLTYSSSAYFDLLHGIGNVLFVLIFYKSFYKILFRFYRRTHYKKEEKSNEKNN